MVVFQNKYYKYTYNIYCVHVSMHDLKRKTGRQTTNKQTNTVYIVYYIQQKESS